MTPEEQFGRNLRMARRRLGLSREALGRSCGIHRQSIYLLENGKRRPRLDTIHRLATALEVKPSELIEGLRR
jgi:transcriptional regulator with XRE-family HTH domain